MLIKLSSPFDVETAQSSVAYRWVSERSTAGNCIATALRTTLWGFASLDEHAKYVERLYQVTREDLHHCALKVNIVKISITQSF
jgi:hypothetical protein